MEAASNNSSSLLNASWDASEQPYHVTIPDPEQWIIHNTVEPTEEHDFQVTREAIEEFMRTWRPEDNE